MKRKIVLCLVADLIVVWITLLIALYLGFVVTIMFHFWGAFILIWYIVRTFKWLRILFDKIFSKPVVIRTKQIRDVIRERVAPIVNSEISPSYSVVRFNDKSLPSKYIYFDECHYKTGEEIEVIYYPRSKYITKITKVDSDVQSDQQHHPAPIS